ncbi:ribonuclease HII [Amphibacillus sp. Q70]|uniref:ribonuclease HII n=1 Tax=Amphibacillus sp. Q70 TaxID=3453416 RepID=UPI003F850FAB
MKDCSIAEIKQYLNEEIISEEVLQSLETDPRKGVQQAIQVYKNKQAKQQLLQKQFLAMKKYEQYYLNQGKRYIAGIDEVGRGPLAGPVVAAAVILPKDFSLLGLTDSKKLSSKQRTVFAQEIESCAVAVGIGVIDNVDIDRVNIYQASILAMEQAVKKLAPKPDHLLIDAVPLPNVPYSSDIIIKGDQKSISIAAASVVAKVYRDQMMSQYHQKYPYYQFDQNQGYGTAGHLQGLKKYGVTPIHRKSFAPIKDYLEGGKDDGITIF